METIRMLLRTNTVEVYAMYHGEELYFTRTTTCDGDGFIENIVTVYADGRYEVMKGEGSC